MAKKILSMMVLGMALMAAGFADASRTVVALRGAADEVQAPRAEEIQAPREEEVQAPRAEEIQAPRGEDVQAPRG